MTCKVEKFASGMHYILLPEEVVIAYFRDNSNRVLCQINNAEAFHAALMPKKEGGSYINLGKSIRDKLGIQAGDLVEVKLHIDESEFEFSAPAELMEVLATDAEAKAVFDTLTPGRQRGIMYLVNAVKSTDKKIERALLIAEKMKLGITNPREIMKR